MFPTIMNDTSAMHDSSILLAVNSAKVELKQMDLRSFRQLQLLNHVCF